MAKALGIGGIFFKAREPAKLAAWYREHLGFDIDAGFGGSIFLHADQPPGGYTVWAPFAENTDYFRPSDKPFMFNLVVDDLEGALEQAGRGAALVLEARETSEFGRFGWFVDPEGNKVELWQPPPGQPQDA